MFLLKGIVCLVYKICTSRKNKWTMVLAHPFAEDPWFLLKGRTGPSERTGKLVVLTQALESGLLI